MSRNRNLKPDEIALLKRLKERPAYVGFYDREYLEKEGFITEIEYTFFPSDWRITHAGELALRELSWYE